MGVDRPRSRHILMPQLPWVDQRTIARTVRGQINMSAIKSNKPAEHEQQPRENGVEGEIREFVRRDGQALRRSSDSDSDLVAHNISTLVQRVAGTSVQEVDRLIAELQQLRDLLHQEGARVQREIAQYAHLSQSAMQSTKIIAESLAHWKSEGGVRG
jgi:cell division septum initiation protein DivIVA